MTDMQEAYGQLRDAYNWQDLGDNSIVGRTQSKVIGELVHKGAHLKEILALFHEARILAPLDAQLQSVTDFNIEPFINNHNQPRHIRND